MIVTMLSYTELKEGSSQQSRCRPFVVVVVVVVVKKI
jgi:hypothetical protein